MKEGKFDTKNLYFFNGVSSNFTGEFVRGFFGVSSPLFYCFFEGGMPIRFHKNSTKFWGKYRWEISDSKIATPLKISPSFF
jgi:hypothetical protein